MLNRFPFEAVDDRLLRARLKTVIEPLPVSTALNPLGVIVFFLPFLTANSPFGHVPLSHFAYAFLPQVVHSAWAMTIYGRSSRDIPKPRKLERELLALQILTSLSWGAAIWLFWDPQSQINHLFAAIITITVVWNILLTRLSHTPIFLAGVLPICAAMWARSLLAGDQVSFVLSYLMPIWLIYILLIGLSGRLRTDAAYRNGLAREDLTVALRASTEEADHKRREAEAANAAKTAFLANMSHELRTPLNAILGFSDIIATQVFGADCARYADYAADIHSSGVHLLNLINDLLDVAKIEAGKMEIDPGPLDAAAVLAEVERLIEGRAVGRELTLSLDVAPDVPPLHADDRAFRQIVLNLLSNAVKFTPKGGHIAVRLRHAPQGGALLEIEDDGVGIPADKLETVFRPFDQVDNRYGRQEGGTGLGLAIVRGLVELHGGQCWIESAVGAGTKVSIYFPLSRESGAPGAQTAA